jgi:GH24 family phage-related lysozyme (muramidase)/LysM repeat protein
MLPTSCLVNKDKDMPNYNTQGITSSAGSDPRNLGGSEGYGNPTASTSSGLMSSTANATTNNDDNDDEPGFFESIANLFSGAGADLPSDKSDDDGDSGISFYDSPMFTPYDGGSDNDTTPQGGLPFETTAADRALYEALGVDVPEVYQGKMPEEEPDPNFDPDVLQSALQPEPITVEEIEVKAGDTLTAIAEEKGVPVQAVIDANPQIKNPDLIRPGEKVTLPGMISDMGKLLKTATDPEAPAPVSEDPDREFYQSGVPIEERVFEGAETGEGLMSPRFDTKGETPEGAIRPKARPTDLKAPVSTKDLKDTAAFDEEVKAFVTLNEGRKNTPYKDTKGLWTVGVGHLIGKTLPKEFTNPDGTPKTLSDREVDKLFAMDYKKHKEEATQLPMYDELDSKGKQALIDLSFNMGSTKFNEKKWPKFFAALKAKDLDKAAIELKDSAWFTDVKNRAPRVIKLIKQAKFN